LKDRQSRWVIFLELNLLLIVGRDLVWVHANLKTFVQSTFLAKLFARLANAETVAV
jgi:hypothetical protein